MAAGVGGLIAGLMGGDPTQQLASALAGPNPNPQAPAGASPSPTGDPGAPPGMAAPSAPALPPAQAYAPDPANASTIALLLRVHQQDQAAAGINRGLQQMSAGFGTAQQQHDKQSQVDAAGQGDDTLGAIGEVQKIQQQQQAIESKNKFLAGADLMGQQMFGLKPGQGQWLASDPQMFQAFAQAHLNNMSLTDQEKNMRDWEASAEKSGMSPEDIQSTKTLLLGQMVGGGTPDVKNMNHDILQWKQQNPGKTDAQMLAEHPEFDSVAGYAAAKAESAKNAIASSKDRLDSKSALPDVEKTIKPITTNIDQILDPANFDHAVTAIHSGGIGTSGAAGVLAGKTGLVDPKTLEMQNAITQLQGQLSGDAMRSQKNIRTQREFNAISAGATPIFSPTATPEQIKTGLMQLKQKFGLAHANAVAAAGGEVPAEYSDQVDKDYMTAGGPLYNGATVEQPPVPGARKAPDGNWYKPDPERPGKFLRVD